MSVKINGAILRNIPSEQEGIDTPSLLINGQPISGGGTQLYKHVTSIEDNYETTWDLVFITTSQTSLENTEVYSLSGQYITGFIKNSSQYYGILSIAGNGEEPILYYIDNSVNLESITAYGIYLGTDTVTTL